MSEDVRSFENKTYRCTKWLSLWSPLPVNVVVDLVLLCQLLVTMVPNKMLVQRSLHWFC